MNLKANNPPSYGTASHYDNTSHGRGLMERLPVAGSRNVSLPGEKRQNASPNFNYHRVSAYPEKARLMSLPSPSQTPRYPVQNTEGSGNINDAFTRMTLWQNPSSPKEARKVSDHTLLPTTQTSPYLRQQGSEEQSQNRLISTREAHPAKAGQHSYRQPVSNHATIPVPAESTINLTYRSHESVKHRKAVADILRNLIGSTISADVWTCVKHDDGSQTGFACYEHPSQNDENYQLKIRYKIPTENGSTEPKDCKTQLYRISGSLRLCERRFEPYLNTYESIDFFSACRQRTPNTPILLNDCTMSVLPAVFTTEQQRKIFERIVSLTNSYATIKLERIHYNQRNGEAWYPLPDLGPNAGVPIGCRLKGVQGSEKIIVRNVAKGCYTISGTIMVCTMRLYRSITEHCPPMYTSKETEIKDGYPVYMATHSIKIEHIPSR